MKTILLADDNISFNSKCRDFLAKDDTLKVVQTFNGKDTFIKYLELQPDAMILDYKLPKWNGQKVLEKLENYELKNNSIKKNTIFITGCSLINTKLLRNSKICCFLPKPLDFSRLAESLCDIFSWNSLESNNYHKEIVNYFLYLGINDPESNNYKYLFYSIELILKNNDLIDNLNNIYYLVSKKFNKSPKQIQNRIRYNIRIIKKYMPKEIQKSLFNVHYKYDTFTTKLFFDKTLVYFNQKN